MKFFCLADEDTVRGFRLAGVDGQVVNTEAEAGQALAQAIARGDSAIVILTHTVAASMREQVDALRLNPAAPLLVEIPGPDGPLAGRKSFRELAHAAVGVCLDPEKGV